MARGLDRRGKQRGAGQTERERERAGRGSLLVRSALAAAHESSIWSPYRYFLAPKPSLVRCGSRAAASRTTDACFGRIRTTASERGLKIDGEFGWPVPSTHSPILPLNAPRIRSSVAIKRAKNRTIEYKSGPPTKGPAPAVGTHPLSRSGRYVVGSDVSKKRSPPSKSPGAEGRKNSLTSLYLLFCLAALLTKLGSFGSGYSFDFNAPLPQTAEEFRPELRMRIGYLFFFSLSFAKLFRARPHRFWSMMNRFTDFLFP